MSNGQLSHGQRPEIRDCPAPAKLNLFLHVIGRRSDGYHLIESVFQLIDLADTLHFRRRPDGRIVRLAPVPGVPEESDSTVRAARLLQQHARTSFGVEIEVEKRIPIGGGLGGGSSDAATTLLALNRLWQLGISRTELMRLALELGADVPFFVFGQNAFVQGIGEKMTSVETSARCFVIVFPGISVPTASIFGAPELTRDTESLRIPDFSAHVQQLDSMLNSRTCANDGPRLETFRNDLEPVTAARFPAVSEALDWLSPYACAEHAVYREARMSGSGACVFCAVSDAAAGRDALQHLPAGWLGWLSRSLAEHPLRNFAAD